MEWENLRIQRRDQAWRNNDKLQVSLIQARNMDHL